MAASLVVAAGPAAAASCPQGSGVTVVVGSAVSCDGNGGGDAASNFAAAGHSLTYVQRQPGFVCKVDGVPADANCVNTPPADAYWGLFWSNGTSGAWTYASQGVGGLSIPKGGWVAFVYQKGGSKTYPSVKPVSAAPAPAPTKKPAARPTKAASSASAGAAKPSPSASPSTAAEKKQAAKKIAARKKAKAEKDQKVAAAASATPTAAEPTATEADLQQASDSSESPGGLWAGAAIAVALLAGMGGMLWRRKVAGGSS